MCRSVAALNSDLQHGAAPRALLGALLNLGNLTFSLENFFVRSGHLQQMFALIGILCAPQFAAGQQPPGTLPMEHPIQDKNFYLLSLFEKDAAAHDAIVKNPELDAIAKERRDAIALALRTCKSDAACVLRAFLSR